MGDVLLRASREAPRRKKGTIFSRDLIGCTAGEVAEELGEQVTEVRALATRNAATASGRFLLSFPEEIPQHVQMDCGPRLTVRQHLPLPLPLRCRSCFVYGHHEDQCNKAKLCPICNKAAHGEEVCENPPSCAACGGAHPVTSPECEAWKNEMSIRRIRTDEGISYAAAVKQLKKPAASTCPPATFSPAPLPRANNNSYANAVRHTASSAKSPAPDMNYTLVAAISRLEAAVLVQTKLINTLLEQNAALLAFIKSTLPPTVTPSRTTPSRTPTQGGRKRQRLTGSASQPRIAFAPATPTAPTVTTPAQQSAPMQASSLEEAPVPYCSTDQICRRGWSCQTKALSVFI